MTQEGIKAIVNEVARMASEEVNDQVISQQLSQHSSMPGNVPDNLTVDTMLAHNATQQHSQRHMEIHTAEVKTRVTKKDEIKDEGLTRNKRVNSQVNSQSIKTEGTDNNSKTYRFESQPSQVQVDAKIQSTQDCLGSEHASGGWKSDRSPTQIKGLSATRHGRHDQSTLTGDKHSSKVSEMQKNQKMNILYHIQTKQRIVEKKLPTNTTVHPKVYDAMKADLSRDLQLFPQRQVRRAKNTRSVNQRQARMQDEFSGVEEVKLFEQAEISSLDKNVKATSTANEDIKEKLYSTLKSKPASPQVNSPISNNRWPVSKILKHTPWGNQILKNPEMLESPKQKPHSPGNISLMAPTQHLVVREREKTPKQQQKLNSDRQKKKQEQNKPLPKERERPFKKVIPSLHMAINNMSQSFESEELFYNQASTTSTKKMNQAQRLKHSVPVQVKENDDREMNDTQTQMRNVSPQLCDISSKGYQSPKGAQSPRFVNNSEEQLSTSGVLKKQTTVEENIEKTIAKGSGVVEYKKGESLKPLTAQFTLPNTMTARVEKGQFDTRPSTKQRLTLANVGGLEMESQIVSEPVISSEYTDPKIYENSQAPVESLSVKFGDEVEKIVVTNMSQDQNSAKEQHSIIKKPINKHLNTRSDGVDLPKIEKKSENNRESTRDSIAQSNERNIRMSQEPIMVQNDSFADHPGPQKINRGISSPHYQSLKGRIQDVSGVLANVEPTKSRKQKNLDALGLGGPRQSIYKEKNRIAQLYTNQDRIAQMINPTATIRDRPPKALPADKSHMAEVHKMFLPATVRNVVVSPLRGFHKKRFSERRTGTSPVHQNSQLPASMQRKGIRGGKTFFSNTHTHVEAVKVEDATKYSTVELGNTQTNKCDEQGETILNDGVAKHKENLRKRLLKTAKAGIPGPLKIGRRTSRQVNTSKNQFISISPWRRNKASRLGTGDDLFNLRGDYSPCGFGTKTRESGIDDSMISYHDRGLYGLASAGRDTPPKIKNKVQEWLNDRNAGQLVLEKYQEVAIPRASRTKEYKAKAVNQAERVEEQVAALERLPTEIVSKAKEIETKRGISMGSFRSRQPSQIGDTGQRLSSLQKGILKGKKSLPDSREDTSPTPNIPNDLHYTRDPRLNSQSNNEFQDERDTQSKCGPQHSPLNTQASRLAANLATGATERKRFEDLSKGSKSNENFSDEQSPLRNGEMDSITTFKRPSNNPNAQQSQKNTQNSDFTITIVSQKISQQKDQQRIPQQFQKNFATTSPRAQRLGLDSFDAQHENVNASVQSNNSMSPKWGPKAKGMTIIQGKENATPTKNSDDKLPRVVGGMKAITVRELIKSQIHIISFKRSSYLTIFGTTWKLQLEKQGSRDKKYSRDIGTAHSPPIMSPDRSEGSVYKPIHTVNTLCQNTFNPNTPMQATSRDSPRQPAQQTILTRLLKGQSPIKALDESLDSEGAQRMQIGEIANLHKITFEPSDSRSFLFHLNTLYATKKDKWRKFDIEYAKFDEDIINNEAPIPPSAQFLLIHNIQKIYGLGIFKRVGSDTDDMIFNQSYDTLGERQKSPDNSANQAPVKIEITDEKEALLQQKAARSDPDGPVSAFVLNEAFKLSKMQLQMCCQSITQKFNNKKQLDIMAREIVARNQPADISGVDTPKVHMNVIFDEMKTQLYETYEQLAKLAI